MEYADDVDFLDKAKKPLDHLQPVAAEKLKVDNLFMNETKTEFTHVYLAEATETDLHGKDVRGNESWRKNKTLGSLLCSTSDITAHCIQGNVTFHTLRKLWSRRTKIPLKARLRLYNAYCVSIMLYNCNSWTAPKVMFDKLDACHRRHLRVITGHCWPKSLISNQALYELCNEEPLSSKVTKQRWSMLGHVLRMNPDTPAQRALDFAVTGSQAYKPRRGRH
ncbi:uncharacterized protein LOC119742796 [Patiria miniata]|uniref:Reverse transcriptase domain-containing protein n=1 Tax=Patiria miniata TaxID=46514 RepID=A0A914BG67_PATMI|nr:uncharacterized protein LOC119742796 [Patiria miniata]